MSPASPKIRLDQLLVDRGLVQSRSRAAALVMAGKVFIGDRRVDKPGHKVAADSEPRVVEADHPYVSRGGVKLEHALTGLSVSPEGLRCLDLGASTGGFTDCLLSHGARRVIAVDVGYGQLHPRLRADPRVVVMERTNARHLKLEDIGGEQVDLVVMDCSFISIELLLPAVKLCLRPGGELLALVKPQFEVGRGEVGRGGVVRDPLAREAALEKVKAAVESAGLEVKGSIPSPIKGPAGNVEFLLLASVRTQTTRE